MLPLGCLPLRGREGVILQAAAENKRIETKEDLHRACFYFLIPCDDPFTVHLGKIMGKQPPESELNRVFKNEEQEYRQNKKKYRIFFTFFFFVV